MSNKSHINLAVSMCITILLSFLYGVITVQYQIFPYDQLKTLKHLVTPENVPGFSNYYYDKKSFFEQHGGHKYDVVFIGDSITDGAEWEDLFPTLRIANRGIAGDRTDGVLNRMDSIYSTNAKKAFIMIGGNDFYAGSKVNDVIKNYRIIIHNLVSRGIKTYVQSTILHGNRETELNKKIMMLNEQLKKMAEKNKTFVYIDINRGLAKKSILDSKYSRDGVHLNGTGYAVWREIVERFILN